MHVNSPTVYGVTNNSFGSLCWSGYVGDNGGAQADIALADAANNSSQNEDRKTVGHSP